MTYRPDLLRSDAVDLPTALRLDFEAGPIWFAAAMPQPPSMEGVFIPGDEIMVVFTARRSETWATSIRNSLTDSGRSRALKTGWNQGASLRVRKSMMAVMPARRSARLSLFGAAFAVLLAAGVGLYATRDPRAEVIDESAGAPGWKTLAYEGVSVDIPSSWERLDMGDCEFRFERWAPPGVPPCDPDAEGIAFYGSATFDSDLGPGVIRNDGADPQIPDWEGYVYAGDFAVHASGNDRAVVESILNSAK